MTPRFEAHITMDKQHRAIAQEAAERRVWTFSEITGCPLLGQGTYCYLTGYNTDGVQLLVTMIDIVKDLKACGVEVLRTKIERIVYDTKTGVDELTHVGDLTDV